MLVFQLRYFSFFQYFYLSTLHALSLVKQYRQYQYIVGGQGGNLSAFTQMQFKIVFRSTNSARTAAIKDLRVIALGV